MRSSASSSEHRELHRERAAIAQEMRQPDHRRLLHRAEIEIVPREEAQREACGGAEQREGRGRRAFAETIEMGADAGADTVMPMPNTSAPSASTHDTGPIWASAGRRVAEGTGIQAPKIA